MPSPTATPNPDPDRSAGHPSDSSLYRASAIVDLTHPLDEDTPFWPGDQGFSLRCDADGLIGPDTYYYANTFASGEHVGTHMDAPRHMHREGWTVEQVPLDRLIGPGVCVDVSRRLGNDPDGCATTDDFIAWENQHGLIHAGALVLLHTGHSRHWSNRSAYYGTADTGESGGDHVRFPGLAPDAARWLVEERHIRAVGIDTPGIDAGHRKDYETHKFLFSRNVPAFENLASLERLPPRGFTVIALPMKIRGGSGAPLRIVALLDS